MRQIVYQREVPAETTEVNGETVVTREAYLQEERLAFTDADKDIQITEALKYSYNGEYTIEDDGKPEPAPTQFDRIESQVTYTAMMTDTLIMET